MSDITIIPNTTGCVGIEVYFYNEGVEPGDWPVPDAEGWFYRITGKWPIIGWRITRLSQSAAAATGRDPSPHSAEFYGHPIYSDYPGDDRAILMPDGSVVRGFQEETYKTVGDYVAQLTNKHRIEHGMLSPEATETQPEGAA